ncbi:hypothetical protein BD289DRAFT_438781 [Coniella lustricola]|uniref:Secreted protein n=1 Tax=Coniella lustricola TaxID=2025994 RepID=A0A2T3A2F2_9PEZI|nr:hypothetical protein BD289DRAFT_438781 [Coniella lustricola]
MSVGYLLVASIRFLWPCSALAMVRHSLITYARQRRLTDSGTLPKEHDCRVDHGERRLQSRESLMNQAPVVDRYAPQPASQSVSR